MNWRTWLRRTDIRREVERHRAYLEDQVVMAEDFYRFVHIAYKKGFDADLIIKVDGQSCATAVVMSSGTCRELFEYLANWAAGERLKRVVSLDQLNIMFPDHSEPDKVAALPKLTDSEMKQAWQKFRDNTPDWDKH